MDFTTVQPVLESSSFVDEKLYTTTELGEIWDVSFAVMDMLTRSLQTIGHGERRRTIFPNGMEDEQFHWNQAGRDAVAKLARMVWGD